MLYSLLTMTSFLGLCFFMVVLWRIPYGFSPLITLSYIGFGGYVAAYYNELNIFNTFNTFLGLLVLIPSLFIWFQRLQTAQYQLGTNKKYTEQSIALIHVGLQIFSVWYFCGAKIRYYDEFYWMSLAKDLFETGGLMKASSAVMETIVPTVHPPFSAIWQSFFSTTPLGLGEQVFQEASAGIAGFSVLTMLFCAVAAVCSARMPVVHAIFVAFIVACAARLLGSYYKAGMYTIAYLEYYQAAFLSLGISFGCFMKARPLQTWSLLCTVILLTGTKATGFLFALAVICAYAVYNFFHYQVNKENIALSHIFKISILLLLGVFLSRMLWVYYITENLQEVIPAVIPEAIHKAIPKVIPEAVSEVISEVIPSAAAKNAVEEVATLKAVSFFQRLENFIIASGSLQNFKGIPLDVLQVWGRAFLVFPLMFSSWLSIEFMSVPFTVIPIYINFALGLVLLYFLRLRLAKEHYITLAVLSLGLLLWFFVRIIIAVNMHSPREVYNAASYSRYVGAYMAVIVVYMTLAFYFTLAKQYTKYRRVFTTTLSVHVIIVVMIMGLTPWHAPRHIPLPEYRLSIERAVDYVQKNTPEKARIWFINQEEDLLHLSVFRALIIPQRRTDLKMPWIIPSDILDIDALKERALANNVEYVFLWNEHKSIPYYLGGKKYESGMEPVLIKMQR